jgi:DNA-directed RNA polymerase specialized sigma24 family protein
MLSSESTSAWWDRGVDEQGRALRSDVREAAYRIWRVACAKAQQALGDTSDAPELLETAIKSVSQYLDRKDVPLYSSDPDGLLVLAFCRCLRRLARRRRRIEPVGNGAELEEMLPLPSWLDEVDRRLFLEQLSHELSKKNRGLLRLRLDGYEWSEIAQMVGMTVTAVRAGFWRDVRKTQLRLLGRRGTHKRVG